MSTKNVVMAIYGGVSPEHEVSVISGLQVVAALKKAGFAVMEVYIAKDGEWHMAKNGGFTLEVLNDKNKILKESKSVVMTTDVGSPLWVRGILGYSPLEKQPDVVFPVIHGRGGEDGTLQGMCDLIGLPYVGCGVTASGIKIDKYLSKRLAEFLGILVAKDRLFIKGEKLVLDGVKLPAFVKPVGLGSSIAVQRVDSMSTLKEAIEVAFCYDRRVMVEEAIIDPTEVNISVIGNTDLEVSITEQPVSAGELLTFDDKYIGNGGRGMAGSKRLMPAEIGKEKIKQIEVYAKEYFRLLGGKGIARLDFMIDKNGKIYFNEINTMPGSLACFLWEKTGKTFEKLVTNLVSLALEESDSKGKLISKFETNLLTRMVVGGGLKGGKIG